LTRTEALFGKYNVVAMEKGVLAAFTDAGPCRDFTSKPPVGRGGESQSLICLGTGWERVVVMVVIVMS
jgi:hypothetical protein